MKCFDKIENELFSTLMLKDENENENKLNKNLAALHGSRQAASISPPAKVAYSCASNQVHNKKNGYINNHFIHDHSIMLTVKDDNNCYHVS